MVRQLQRDAAGQPPRRGRKHAAAAGVACFLQLLGREARESAMSGFAACVRVLCVVVAPDMTWQRLRRRRTAPARRSRRVRRAPAPAAPAVGVAVVRVQRRRDSACARRACAPASHRPPAGCTRQLRMAGAAVALAASAAEPKAAFRRMQRCAASAECHGRCPQNRQQAACGARPTAAQLRGAAHTRRRSHREREERCFLRRSPPHLKGTLQRAVCAN
jgi:hypothetical protein